jgi:uncharacterized metal-binding protein YceD (DUF177 family)
VTLSQALPFSQPYNLNRLGQAGEEVRFAVGEAEREALARFADVMRVEAFAAMVDLKKLSPNRFRLEFSLEADIVQACVVTLAEVPAHIQLRFDRELHFAPSARRAGEAEAEVEVPLDDDLPEEIDSLRYDLAAPLVEEFVLAIDPYPRAPGVEFQAPEGGEAKESPFAVLKRLKTGP